MSILCQPLNIEDSQAKTRVFGEILHQFYFFDMDYRGIKPGSPRREDGE
jgi:hypothetical protein